MNSSIKNVAIIMDGNGRWAKERRRPRIWGHIRGSRKVTEIVTKACELNLESLTLYAFSTENWSRPTDEVSNLFKILKKFLLKEKSTILKNNIRFSVVGNYRVLETELVEIIDSLQDISAENTGMKLNLAVNYGGRAEIIDAVNSYVRENPGKAVREEDISQNLYDNSVVDIDLMIRTAGDKRISNFLLWQTCYAEFYFSNTQWPEFTAFELEEIINSVSTRERRFGGVLDDSTLKVENQSTLKN